MIERRLSPNTQASYVGDLRRFFAWATEKGHDASSEGLTPQPVRHFLADRLDLGSAKRTSARMLSSLLAFDRWLV
jgi:site-specific recombinase XerD